MSDDATLANALFGTLYDAGVNFESATLIPQLVESVRACGYKYEPPAECICYGYGIHHNCRAHDAPRKGQDQ